jgi:hypothetical protein
MCTPDFAPWAGGFARHLQQWRSTSAAPLHQFQRLAEPWIAHWRLAQQEEGPHSRDRLWNLRLVFWTFFWQVAQAGASCREAIRQAQALCMARGAPPPPDTTSAYCQARSGLPLERLQEIHDGLVREAEAALALKDLWCGHRVLVADGSSLTAPDTAPNQQAFPQQRSQKPGCGFPTLRVVALLSLATGLLSAWATGSLHVHEIPLLQSLWEHLRPGDILLADRGFCSWGLIAQALQDDLHVVFRLKGRRRGDFRRGKRLSKEERLVQWSKPKECAWTIDAAAWALLPPVLTLRLVRCRVQWPGFRTRQVILVTTLLDSAQYPPAALGQLYLRRWAMELTLRNIKTTLQMDYLSCKTPENLEREIRLHFLVHNLVRRLMLEAARRHRVALERISFAGSLAAARRYAEALLQARSKRRRAQLQGELLRALAADLLPERPGRREPRAVKRRPKAYPLLTAHRHTFREIRHQSKYVARGVPKAKTPNFTTR